MIDFSFASLSLSGLGNLLVVRSLLGLGVLAAVLLVDRGLRGRLPPNARFVLFFGVLLSFVAPPLWNVVLPESTPQVLTFVRVSSAEALSPAATSGALPVTRVASGEGFEAAGSFGAGSIIQVLAWVYAVGVCLAFGLLFRRLLKTRRLVRNAEPGPSPGVYWADVVGPCVVGLATPCILLPRCFAALHESKMAMVLRHERQHIRRGDLWTRLVQNLIQVVFWFHPGVWWLNRRIDDLREMAVDAALLRSGLVRRRDYCELLLELASNATVSAKRAAPRWALAMAGSPRMTQRITACLQPVHRGRRRWMVVCLLPLGAILLPGGCTSTPKTTASPVVSFSTPKSGLTPHELSPPPLIPAGVDPIAEANARDAKTQIQLQSWFVELPSAELSRFGDLDEATYKKLRDLGGVDLLSAPTVTTLPGMKAMIEIGREMLLSEAATEPDFTGVRLEVLPSLAAGLSATTPFEVARRQPITLQTQALVSELATRAELQAKGRAEDETAVAYRAVAKTLSLADGEFAEIGRIRKMHTTQVEDRAPLLGDIPLLGRAFRHSSIEHQERTIVILIKPTLKPVK